MNCEPVATGSRAACEVRRLQRPSYFPAGRPRGCLSEASPGRTMYRDHTSLWDVASWTVARGSPLRLDRLTISIEGFCASFVSAGVRGQ